MEIATDNFHPAAHWFVPLNELDAERGAPLRPADMKPADDDPLAKEEDSFLVTLESLLIVEKHDRKSNNDLLVRSRLKYGNAPVVEAINLFANDVPAGIVISNLLCEYIYGQENYSKLDRVHLEIEVMELPGKISLNGKIGKGLRVIKNTFGMVLSSLVPFGGIAYDVIKDVNTFRKQSDRIFFSNLDLYGVGGEGEARLRYGAYIFFKTLVDGAKFKLHKLQLKPLVADDPTRPVPHDYVVVKVVPIPIRVGSNEALALKHQKVATVLSTMEGQLDDTVRPPKFDTASADAQKLRNLALLYSLQKRKAARETLDEAQTQLYQKLQQELQAFISS
ncbi:hypothetical protein N836_04745 [Leptolyngbya sp. Heron Island J]|uniref:hypothetical protein n=1 Tax=Leptolyngbya sp. Heron Island J TaxID=1385935 RepID=UPI0003B98B30|nr:hypothetical protein [Leptolyngbya sp. Heron Island J]ESA36870.1 hypothetical protein N836_04745 [Leptolyngbya sp. Heron Island J]